MAVTLERFYWSFGDGTFSDEKSPSHTYTMGGIFTVTHTVTNTSGTESSFTFTVTVYDQDYPTTSIVALSLADSLGDTADLDIGVLYPELTVPFFDVSTTTRCLRFAIKPQHGIGWSFYDGSYWIFPSAYVDTLKIYSEEEQPIQLAWDSRLGLPYRMDLRDQWLDQEGLDSYNPGHEIPTEIRFKEDRGTAEHYILESLEHHAHVRPYDEETRGQSGYRSNGLRDAFEVELDMLLDGEQITPNAKTVMIPLDGDIVFDRRLEGHRQQLIYKTVGSQYKLVRRRSYYIAKDKQANPTDNTMTEHDYQEDISDTLMWVTRSDSKQLDRATGNTGSGSYFAETTGPDGFSDTAMQFNGSQGIVTALQSNLSGDYTLSGWLANASGAATLFSTSTGSLLLGTNASGQIIFNDGTSLTSVISNWNTNGWIMVSAVRTGTVVNIYLDGVLMETIVDAAYGTYGGNVSTGTNQICDVFDLRVYDSALTAAELLYIYNDVTENSGNAVLIPYE